MAALPCTHCCLSQSFIHRVKTQGAQGMLGKFSNTGLNFDRTLSDLTVTKVGPSPLPLTSIHACRLLCGCRVEAE